MTSAEIDAAVRAGAAALCTVPEIAARLGLSRHVISGRVRKLGLVLPQARRGRRRSLPMVAAVVPAGLVAATQLFATEEMRRADCANLRTYDDTPNHMRGPFYGVARKELDDSYEALRALGVEP